MPALQILDLRLSVRVSATAKPLSRLPRARVLEVAGLTAALTVAAAAGARRWALPDRVFGGWRVADVPGSLSARLAVATAVCLVSATVVTFLTARLRLGEPAGAARLTLRRWAARSGSPPSSGSCRWSSVSPLPAYGVGSGNGGPPGRRESARKIFSLREVYLIDWPR